MRDRIAGLLDRIAARLDKWAERIMREQIAADSDYLSIYFGSGL